MTAAAAASRILIGLLLMATSNGVAWHMVTKSSKVSLSALRSAVWKIALFYTLWALYNRYPGGRDGELGHFSFGMLCLTCVGTAQFGAYKQPSGNPKLVKALLVAASGLVVLNFSVVFPLIVQSGGPFGIAKLRWGVEDDNELSLLVKLWALVLTAYMASNVVLWSYCGYLFYQLPLGSGEDRGYTTPTIETTEYQPVETADV